MAVSDGLTQLDPQKSGIKQKGVLAFRVLQTARSLVLNIEQVDAWIQVTSLQHATVGESQTKIAANLQYQIENTGLKSFRVLIPTNAENVRFQGEQVSDFLPGPGSATNGLMTWEVRLHRRVLGAYLLQLTYQVPVFENAKEVRLRGVQALDVNLQRGYVTVQSGGRLQVRVDSAPAALQPAEWQSIPRALQQGLPASAANFSYRLVEAGFELPLNLDRYQAAQLLPGRVSSITFSSVISEEGMMLTQARLQMFPGEKRLLRITLPKEAHFWFAFVNQNGVWPWRERDEILIPLEQQSLGEKLVPVELFYSCQIGSAGRGNLNLELLAPKFDLPLENITWRVSLSEKWKVKKWSGSLQLQSEELDSATRGARRSELSADGKSAAAAAHKESRRFAGRGQFCISAGRTPGGAPRISIGFRPVDSRSRVQRRCAGATQQYQTAGSVGWPERAAGSFEGDAGALGDNPRIAGSQSRQLHATGCQRYYRTGHVGRECSLYAFGRAFDPAAGCGDNTPAALHASIPERGTVLTFKRAVLVDPWAALKIDIKAGPVATPTWLIRGAFLAVTFLVLFGLTWIGRGHEASQAATQ